MSFFPSLRLKRRSYPAEEKTVHDIFLAFRIASDRFVRPFGPGVSTQTHSCARTVGAGYGADRPVTYVRGGGPGSPR